MSAHISWVPGSRFSSAQHCLACHTRGVNSFDGFFVLFSLLKSQLLVGFQAQEFWFKKDEGRRAVQIVKNIAKNTEFL